MHKVIICSQSKVLHAACSKPFEVSKILEPASHQLTNTIAGGGEKQNI